MGRGGGGGGGRGWKVERKKERNRERERERKKEIRISCWGCWEISLFKWWKRQEGCKSLRVIKAEKRQSEPVSGHPTGLQCGCVCPSDPSIGVLEIKKAPALRRSCCIECARIGRDWLSSDLSTAPCGLPGASDASYSFLFCRAPFKNWNSSTRRMWPRSSAKTSSR